MKKYKLICKKGEGTFSEVVKAQNLETGKDFAIKCMKSSFDSFDQVNSLREIQALRRLTPHPNIIHLEEVLYDEPSGRLAMVFELMDANLYDLISGRRDHLDTSLIQSLGSQLFIGLDHMHSKGIFHRDIKPENILVDSSGESLKLADLGSCRSTLSRQPLTEYIATRWYRSPECLLTDGYYGPEMDIFGAGCVLFELIALFPLFPGADEVDQVNRIHKVLGSPSAEILSKLKLKGSSKINYKFPTLKGIGIKHFIPHASMDCINLLNKTLIYDYENRINAKDAIGHQFFKPARKLKPLLEPKTILKTSESNKKLLKRSKRVEINIIKQDSKGKQEKVSSNKISKSLPLRKTFKTQHGIKTDLKVHNLRTIKNSLTQSKSELPTSLKAVRDQNGGGSLLGKKLGKPERQKGDQDPSNGNTCNGNAMSRRRNPRPQMLDKNVEVGAQMTESKQKQKHKHQHQHQHQHQPQKINQKQKFSEIKNGLSKRTNKYSNISSSGYGTKQYKPNQRIKRKTSNAVSQNTAETSKLTTNTSLSGQPTKNNRLQKSKLSVSRVSGITKKNRHVNEFRLPRISNV